MKAYFIKRGDNQLSNNNLKEIIDNSFGYASEEYVERTGGTIGHIIQSIIVKHAISVVARRLYINEKIHLNIHRERGIQEL